MEVKSKIFNIENGIVKDEWYEVVAETVGSGDKADRFYKIFTTNTFLTWMPAEDFYTKEEIRDQKISKILE